MRLSDHFQTFMGTDSQNQVAGVVFTTGQWRKLVHIALCQTYFPITIDIDDWLQVVDSTDTQSSADYRSLVVRVAIPLGCGQNCNDLSTRGVAR